MNNELSNLSIAELEAELEKRKTSQTDFKPKKSAKKSITPEWVGKFIHEIPNQSSREKFAQYSTPPHIAEVMTKILTDDFDVKDQIIYEPFVGAGAMFLPLRNKGAVLVGSDIDLGALEICKQLVPEAILIHHDSLGCLEPQSNIKCYQAKIKAIQGYTKRNKKQIVKDKEEIERLEKRIEKEKQRTPWRWDYYCVEHLIQEPPETFLRLTKILRDREIKKMREEHNENKEMFFVCFKCGEKETDYQICQDEQGNVICQKCYKNGGLM